MDEEESVPGSHGTPVCQFYKRKRCQREERCNFVHDTNATRDKALSVAQTDGADAEQPTPQESGAAEVEVDHPGVRAGEETRESSAADVVDAHREQEQGKSNEGDEEEVEATQEGLVKQGQETKDQQDQVGPDGHQQAQEEAQQLEQAEVPEPQEKQVNEDQERLPKEREQDPEIQEEMQEQVQGEDEQDSGKDKQQEEEMQKDGEHNNQDQEQRSLQKDTAADGQQVSDKEIPLQEQVAQETESNIRQEVGQNLPIEQGANVRQVEIVEGAIASESESKLPQNDDLPTPPGIANPDGLNESLREEQTNDNIDATATSAAAESRNEKSHQESQSNPADDVATDTSLSGKNTLTSKDFPDVNTNYGSSTDTAVKNTKETDVNVRSDPALTRQETSSTRRITDVADVTSGKTIRRDSKGFEDFDDYFTESENDATGDSSTLDQSTGSSRATAPTTSTTAKSRSEYQSQHFAKKSKAPPAPQEDAPGGDKFVKEMNQAEGTETTKRTDSNGEEAEVVALVAEECEEGETIESIQNFIASTPVATQKNSSKNENSFNNTPEQTPIAAAKAKKVVDESIYDLDIDGESDEGGNLKETAALSPRKTPSLRSTRLNRKDELAEKDLVTKIGNNTYFYTGGNKRSNESAEISDEEDSSLYLVHRADDSDLMSDSGRPSGPGSGKSYMQGRKQHRTDYVYGAKSTSSKARRCGECEGCNRADCGKCAACKDKPKFGGRGLKKQACVLRVCTWKHPSGRKGGGSTSASKSKARGAVQRSGTLVPRQLVAPSPRNATKKTTETPDKMTNAETPDEETTASAAGGSNSKRRRSRQKIPVIAPSGSEEIDDDSLKPGSRVRKGSDEYVVVMSGSNTGLCGKYWADLDNLPPRRSRRSVENQRLEEENISNGTPKRRKNEDEDSTKKSTKRGSKKQEVEISDTAEMMLEASKPPKKRAIVSEDDSQSASSPSKRTRKAPDSDQAEVSVISTVESALTSETNSQPEENILARAKRAIDEATLSQNGESVPVQANANAAVGPSSGGLEDDHRQETTTNGVVEMECFAPYDDHRWVNIGRKEDGMPADAVQYVRALRPPYHLLSFIRIQGNSMKGFSCTDKNTMVFVVLEGEVNVVLHTTQFVAKKGDSFYIPAKNFYNLINQREEKAELFLIQFQYDGPVPMIPATSQSGQPKTA